MTREIIASRKQDWGTPSHLVAQWVEEYDLNTDLCAEWYNAALPHYITPEMDSLSRPWTAPMRGFCNPPYSNIGAWLCHALRSCAHGAFSIHLVPANPDTVWFSEYAARAEVHFFKGRINFVDRTPPDVEIQRLMTCATTKQNAAKLAHRLILLEQAGQDVSQFVTAMERCFLLLGKDFLTSGEYAKEKKPGAGFPTMLVVFDPHAPAGPKPFRMRCGKTGKLL